MIDWSRIEELQDEIGAEDFGDVVELFLAEVEGCLEQLDPADDAPQMETHMHFLKGSALNLGFTAFAALCQDGETKASSGCTDAIDVDAVRQLFATSKSEFEQSLSRKVA